MGLGLGAVEAPVLEGVHFRALRGEAVHDFAWDLNAVAVAEHVPLPDGAAHAREVREEHAGDFALHGLGHPQIAGDKKAGRTLKIHFLHRVAVALNAAVAHDLQVGLCGHGPKALRDEDALTDLLTALIPLREAVWRAEGKVTIEVLQRAQAVVGGKQGTRQGGEKQAGSDHPRVTL